MTSHFRAIRSQRLISVKFMRHSRMFQKLQDFKNLQKYRKSKNCKKIRKNPKKCNFLIKMSRSELNDQILKKSPWLSGFCSENPNYGDLGFCLMDLRFDNRDPETFHPEVTFGSNFELPGPSLPPGEHWGQVGPARAIFWGRFVPDFENFE